MNALRFDGGLKLDHDAEIPRREGEALVKVILAGICNTDLEITKGYTGFRGTLGHEFVGRVVESADSQLVGNRVVGEINVGCGACKQCLEGDSRHCASRSVLGIKDRDGAFAEFLSLPVRNLFEVPDSMSDETAVFIEPLAAALNTLEQVSPNSETKVAIVGDGKLAQLIALVVGQTDCELTVVGKHQEKLSLALDHGAKRVLLDSHALELELRSRFDVVIEASGSASGLSRALKLTRPRGTVVLKSTHHELTSFDTSQIVVNELTIIGSRCGQFKPALDLLTRKGLDLSYLVSLRLPLEEGVLAFSRMSEPGMMKVILSMA
jgi:threonine dehydrogenase-like Zn-dependent dehydrogenase